MVSIADRASPRQVAFVDTHCGSHTHMLVPDEANNCVLIYALSYPLGGQSPTAARVISTPGVSPVIGCHDVTVFLPGNLAGAACITELQLWDISDPAKPRVLSHIVNPAINIHHSTTFSNDGKTLAIGAELGGAAVSPGCASALSITDELFAAMKANSTTGKYLNPPYHEYFERYNTARQLAWAPTKC